MISEQVMRTWLLCCCAVPALLTTKLDAATFVYSEAVDGDLPGTGAPLPVLELVVGENTIVGTLGRDAAIMDDFDSFAFTVPVGTQVTMGRIEINDAEGNLFWSYWEFFAGTANWRSGTLLGTHQVNSPGVDQLDAPLGPGVYNLSNVVQSYYDPVPALATYAFTFTLVPEPASATLLLIVVSLLFLAVRRQIA